MVSSLFPGCVTHTLPPRFLEENPPFHYEPSHNTAIRLTRDTSLLNRPDVLYVHPVKWSTDRHLSNKLRMEFERFLREYFYQGLLKDNDENMIITKRSYLESFQKQGLRIVDMELVITRMKPGSGLLRYLVGFGLGKTDLQIEGRLKEHDEQKEIMAFIMRYRHLGNSYNGLNPRALSGSYCLKMSIEKIALSITGQIREIWNNMDHVAMPCRLELAAFER